jgi:hypothetical protein
MLGLSSHDLSAMRELLGMPKKVVFSAQRGGGLYLAAAFDYAHMSASLKPALTKSRVSIPTSRYTEIKR